VIVCEGEELCKLINTSPEGRVLELKEVADRLEVSVLFGAVRSYRHNFWGEIM